MSSLAQRKTNVNPEASTYVTHPDVLRDIRAARARVMVFDVLPGDAPWRWRVVEAGSGRGLAIFIERDRTKVVEACRRLYPWAEYAGDIRAEEALA